VGLITGLLTWPLAPVRGVAWVADRVLEEAERQWSSPEAIRAELAEVERLRDAGLIDPDEAESREHELVARLLAGAEGGGFRPDTWEGSDDG
jgi:hypothetical protein